MATLAVNSELTIPVRHCISLREVDGIVRWISVETDKEDAKAP